MGESVCILHASCVMRHKTASRPSAALWPATQTPTIDTKFVASVTCVSTYRNKLATFTEDVEVQAVSCSL